MTARVPAEQAEQLSPGDVPVAVQLVRIGVHEAVLRWHSTTAALRGPQNPDVLARHLAGLDQPDAGRVTVGMALHSTSWHHAHGQVVLTYANFPDPGATPDWAPLTEHLAVCAGPLHPSPTLIAGGHVAAHAARHLADLAGGRDPHLSACAAQRAEPWTLLLDHAAGVHAHRQSQPL